MVRGTEVISGTGSVIRSASFDTSAYRFWRPTVKLVQVFYECFSSEYRVGDVGAKDL